MILRAITIVGALAGGAGLSQFPEYSQQYQQRLAGAVDEMRVVVAQFDASVEAVGQTRAEVFAQSEGSDLEMRLIRDGQRNVQRYEFLQAALDKVQGASVLTRLFSIPSVADAKVAKQAYADFKPAVPITVEGLACAGLGFIGGWIVMGMLIAFLRSSFRLVFRRKTKDVV